MKDKKVLIIGGTGSWGEMLLHYLLMEQTKEIRVLARNESKLFYLKQKYPDKRIQFMLGDIRDRKRLMEVCKGIDIIFHLAALKHVPICEGTPTEAILTNVLGTRNVIDCANGSHVEKVIYTSTDKVVDANGTYGCTKLLGEKLMLCANKESGYTKFIIFRSGNLLGSEGSVVPLFKKQIEKKGRVQLTDKSMNRFFVSISKASKLLLEAAAIGSGGEIFITHMPSLKIYDIAKFLLASYGKDESNIDLIGIREGERISESLVTKEEQKHIYRVSAQLYAIGTKKSDCEENNCWQNYKDTLAVESENAIVDYDEAAVFLVKAGI